MNGHLSGWTCNWCNGHLFDCHLGHINYIVSLKTFIYLYIYLFVLLLPGESLQCTGTVLQGSPGETLVKLATVA